MRWTEGHIHLAMRSIMKARGWTLVAGEFPGGSDHELYPLNVVDPAVARDASPDPRRHSLGELIPDLVALKGRRLTVFEAKVLYSEPDRLKLEDLLSTRRDDLLAALNKFAHERNFPDLLPVEGLKLMPVLAFRSDVAAPPPTHELSYLRVSDLTSGYFEGRLDVGSSLAGN
jgi:hypothetical protein